MTDKSAIAREKLRECEVRIKMLDMEEKLIRLGMKVDMIEKIDGMMFEMNKKMDVMSVELNKQREAEVGDDISVVCQDTRETEERELVMQRQREQVQELKMQHELELLTLRHRQELRYLEEHHIEMRYKVSKRESGPIDALDWVQQVLPVCGAE